MSLPRHILSALQIPRVTQARASTDYAFHLDGKAQQWTIGISSMFVDAIGLTPFKDVFWSTSLQPGSPYKPNAEEVLPEREILIATLSTGPVSPGDDINHTNTQHIMKCCRGDGVIWSYDNPTAVSTFDDDHPLNVSATKCHDLSICLWYVSPLIKFSSSTKYALLGEWNKWTAMSSQQVIGINNYIGINLALITVYGLVSEVVPILVFHSTLSIVNVTCRMHPDEGEAQLVVADDRVGCY
ncbi:unnamed protein product [Rotaria sp. Silwood1]|nr:unnamed protein product [Rotaria sp. Silwood1]